MERILAEYLETQAQKGEAARAMEYGDLVVSYLQQLGVEYVFGVPGGAIEPFVDALARSGSRGGPQCIMSRHEAGAAFMADGYHCASGKLGVCFATTGPGATNLVTGVASAYANNVPLLVITAQTALPTFGKNALQESSDTGINVLSIFESITRYNTLVSHPEQLEQKFAAAVMAALGSVKGPAHLSVPIDIFKHSFNGEPAFPQIAQLVCEKKMVDLAAVEDFYKLLSHCKKPIFIVGEEAHKAIESILEVVERLNIPVVTTPHGKGLINPYHSQYGGVIGFAGHESAEELLTDKNVDLVIAVGTSLGEWASNGWDSRAILNRRLVHVEASEKHFAASPMARLHLMGNLETVFATLLERIKLDGLRKKTRCHSIQPIENKANCQAPQLQFQLKGDVACNSVQAALLPQQLMAELPRLFPATTCYLADSGNSFAWAIHYLNPGFNQESGWPGSGNAYFKGRFEFAAMGWAIASAVGVSLALPDRPVVCITGDGSYLMSGQEITVAIQHQLPVIYLILNDSAYGMVKHGQRLTEAEQFGFQLPEINFAAMATAMGVPGHVIESVEDLHTLDMEAICQRKGPTLLDVRIDGEAEPPISLRTKILRGSL